MDFDDRTVHRYALYLIIGTIIWDAIEAGVALISGIRASSIALVAFGLDSFIEIAAASTLLWRLRKELKGQPKLTIVKAEAKALYFVGWTFVVLAIYILIRSGWVLFHGIAPQESLVGILLALIAIPVMSALAWGKLQIADRIDSDALRAEAKESLACLYLAIVVLLGLGLNALWGWWWADPVAALAMTPWLIHEGWEGISG